MKRNGVPHQLDLMRRNATFLHKGARRIGSVDLEALLPIVVVGQSQIVQDRGNRQELGVRRRARPFRNQDTKKS